MKKTFHFCSASGYWTKELQKGFCNSSLPALHVQFHWKKEIHYKSMYLFILCYHGLKAIKLGIFTYCKNLTDHNDSVHFITIKKTKAYQHFWWLKSSAVRDTQLTQDAICGRGSCLDSTLLDLKNCRWAVLFGMALEWPKSSSSPFNSCLKVKS